MLQQSVISYSGGMDQDTARDSYPANKYYSASNMKLLTKDGLATGDLASEPGNTLSFDYPDIIYSIYKISFTTESLARIGTVFGRRIRLLIGNLQGGVGTFEVDFAVGETISPDTVYAKLTANFGIAAAITGGFICIKKYGDYVNVIALDGTLAVYCDYSDLLVSPQRYFSLRGSIVIRDIVILFTVSESVTIQNSYSYQVWKLNTTDNGSVVTDLVNYKLVPSKHLIYNSPDLSFPTSYKVRGLGNYETPEIVKIYFTDAVNNLRHMNVMDTNVIGYPVEHFDIVPDVTFGTLTVGPVEGGGNYKAGMVQYSYCLFNVHGGQTTYSPVSPLVHLTGSAESGMSTRYVGSALDTIVNKAVNVNITGLDQNFDYVRVVALHYNSVSATPDINIVKEIEIPESGEISFIDGGNSYEIVTYSEFTTIGSVNFMCKAMEIKNNILFTGNITQDFFDVTGWDARAYRFDSVQHAWFDDSAKKLHADDFKFEDDTELADNADCIQKDAYSDHACKYNSDINLGGEGPNLKYEFIITQIPLDDFGTGSPAELGVNLLYGSYALAQDQADHTGYHRRETYRFGIVFFNEKGQSSFAKWIADIRMPAMDEMEPTKVTYVDGAVNHLDYRAFFKETSTGKIFANALGLKFYIKSLPAGVTGYRIVRCKREEWDKTIVAQGLWNKCVTDTTTFPLDLENDAGTTIGDSAVGCLVSPEVSFFKNIKRQEGDYIQVVGIMNSIEETVAGPNEFTVTRKYTGFDSDYDGRYYGDAYEINDTKIAGPGWAARFMVANSSFANYVFCAAPVPDESKAWYYHATALFFVLDAVVPLVNWPAVPAERMDFLVNYCRNVSQYGGNSYDARLYNQYIPCTPLLTTEGSYEELYGGDTFVDYFDCMLQPYDKDTVIPPGWETIFSRVIYLPVETSINLSLRTDKSFSKAGDLVYRAFLSETAGVHDRFTQASDMYLYNTAYSKQSESQVYTIRPAELSPNEVFDSRIFAALTKIYGELIDKWTIFLPDNKIDVDGRYGGVNALLNWEDKLVFMQDTGWGAVSVNEKILTIPDETGQSLTLGKGGILDDFRYVSTRTGCTNFDHVYVGGITKDVIYYIDSINNNLMLYTATGQYYAKNETAPLSIMKGVMSFMNNLRSEGLVTQTDSVTGTGMTISYYPDARRVMFTFSGGEYQRNVALAFSEVGQVFEGVYDFGSNMYITVQNTHYSMLPQGSAMYLNGSGYDGVFFDMGGSIYNLELILNPMPLSSKTFTNVEYNLTVTVQGTGVDSPFTNFNDLRLYNDYQDSGIVPLVYGENCRRRFRIWRCDLPRNAGGQLDRIRSQSARLQFRFYNTITVSPYRSSFVLEPMTIKFVPNDY